MEKPKKVVVVHTSTVSVDGIKELFDEIIPEATVHNIIDDSLLAEVMENNDITPAVQNRLTNYFKMAESIGADVILSQCSSVGKATENASNSIKIPVVKIDQAMMRKAVEMGSKIALVATVPSTLKPSSDLLYKCAEETGKKIELEQVLVDGALKVLIETGDKEKHNAMVLDKIQSIDGKFDVIVLAQGSMTRLIPFLENIKTPILTSPRLGVQNIREVLGL